MLVGTNMTRTTRLENTHMIDMLSVDHVTNSIINNAILLQKPAVYITPGLTMLSMVEKWLFVEKCMDYQDEVLGINQIFSKYKK